jgi:REP element-mobilizing transposase RayT
MAIKAGKRKARARQAELDFDEGRHGGRRPGAGRKRRGRRRGHARRPRVSRHRPLHVTLRMVKDVGRLRRRRAWKELRGAFLHGHRKPGFRICHFSIQNNHIHLVVEAHDNRALAVGMQGFNVRLTRRLNRACGGRRGTAFEGRYDLQVMTSPRQVRSGLRYVLLNSRRHAVDLDELHGHLEWRASWVDQYASWAYFDGWREGMPAGPPPANRRHWLVSPPESWLLREGWLNHGLISVADVPGPARCPR